MTLSNLVCLARDAAYSTPFPIQMGIIGASILSVLPFLLLAMKKWISDLGRYGILFPYVWAACFIVLLLATLLENSHDSSVIPSDCRGWNIYLIIFGVSMVFSLITYCGSFLLLCLLEVISHRFRRFFILWVFCFIVITLTVYIIATVEEGGTVLYEWSNLKFWKRMWKSTQLHHHSETAEFQVINDDFCFKNDDDSVDMRKCKTPAIY